MRFRIISGRGILIPFGENQSMLIFVSAFGSQRNDRESEGEREGKNKNSCASEKIRYLFCQNL